jgi:spore coat protein CotH
VLNRPDFWSVASHCPVKLANYDEVFDASRVRRFDITIAATQYAAMAKDLKDNIETGSGDLDGLPTPITVPVTVGYDGKTWTYVGMRWKGHASLKGAIDNGIEKLAFVLSFEKYENDHPELKNQRFFGFEKLNFANAYNDPSLIRDKTAADIFRAAGVLAPRSSFAAVYLDIGTGPVYRGLYTVIEDPSDKMLKVQLGDDSGNLYKPWGNAARWLNITDAATPTTVTEADIQSYFEKQNNNSSDWSDVTSAIQALHADRTDAATWRNLLEASFDVSSFLKVLAVNQVMVNWDSYGCKHHNYLVYANPKDKNRLKWMPWDLNESLWDKENSLCAEPGSILLDEIVKGDMDATGLDVTTRKDVNWPLIRFLLADATYKATYLEYVKEVLNGAFNADAVITAMRTDHALIAPYVVGPTATEVAPYTALPNGADDFNNSLVGAATALEAHVLERHTVVQGVLSANGL